MRLFPILAALLVIAAIYAFVFEREWVLALLPEPAAEEVEQATAEAAEAPAEADVENGEPAVGVSVVAVHSKARPIDRAVVVRGQTEADRQVELRAETSGQVVSEPLRKGNFVEEGDVLCELDPGTRESVLADGLSPRTVTV